MADVTDISPLARVMRHVDEVADGAPSPDTVRTGFPSVDKLLGGGARRGDLVVLGGDVSSGKSALALAMALRAAQGERNAAFLTGEMSVSRVLERTLAMEGRVSVDGIRGGKLDEGSRASIGAAAVRLLVDALQSLTTGARARDEELAVAVRELKALAVDLDVAIVVTTQLPALQRDRNDLRPRLGDYGALGAVAEYADVVLGLFREEMYDTARGIEGATELIVNKNRNGGTSYADLYFYKKWMRFEDMLDPDR